MKKTLLFLGAFSLLGSGLGWAKHHHPPATDTTDTSPLVTAVTPGPNDSTTITISNDNTPFVASPVTTILVDGQPATIASVQVGMRVLSRTAPDSAQPEIDLKTVPPPTPKPKKKQDPNGDDSP